jgi:tetratricopeptide (TPR) repeat protein
MLSRLNLILILFLSGNLYGQDPDELNRQAIELIKSGKRNTALKLNDKSLKLDPAKKETYFVRGLIFLGDDNLKDAELNFKKSIEIDSNYIDPYDYLPVVYFDKKQYKKGLVYFDKAIQLDPTVFRYLGRANLRGVTKDYLGAIEDCNEILNLEPINADAYYTRGKSKFALKDKAGACDDLRQAIALGRPKDEFFTRYCDN